MHNTKQLRSSHLTLVLPPLVITLVFCYGFVLMQPHAITQLSASAHTTPPAETTTPSSANLPTSSFTQQQTLPVVIDTTDSGATASSIVTSTPQTGSASADLQDASNSNGEGLVVHVRQTSGKQSSHGFSSSSSTHGSTNFFKSFIKKF